MTSISRKVVFDTDPGVDDAMALLFLARAKAVRLLGVTTTLGNARIETTTRNALHLCERFGIDAPVAKGAAAPLVLAGEEPSVAVHGQNGLGDVPLPDTITKPLDGRAAHRFLIDTVRAHPGEVSIVAVGRMTNLALALREDPDIAGLVREVIVMGGAFGFNGQLGNVSPAAEANIAGDPHAADIVFGAAWPVTVVGLDVTHGVAMPTQYLRGLAEEGGEAERFLWDVSRFYERFYHSVGLPHMYMHDSTAVAYLLDPSLFETRSGTIRVVTEGIALGQTIQKPDTRRFAPGPWDGRPSQRICTKVRAHGVLDLYRGTLLG
ncbi:MAG: nucleoside hydrolase [Mesorhizobium amorphae]|nr:MAG: nucleoside hydrolase [Mesorhizobium amorphae]